MINLSADLKGLGSFVGSIDGMLNAVETPGFKGSFVGHITGTIKNKFMAETIAARNASEGRLAHVFEWGATRNEPSNTPLFKITSSGSRTTKSLSYVFLPSTVPVPLPDSSRYGFNTAILGNMRRHTFQLKALVMETQSQVTIAPKAGKALFIPTTDSPKGYIMTTNPVNINPGGRNATGGFAEWWNQWFASRAQEIVTLETKRTEEFLGATGKRLVRHAAGTVIGGRAVGGRFATGKGVSIPYINAESERAKREVALASAKFFDEDGWEGSFD